MYQLPHSSHSGEDGRRSWQVWTNSEAIGGYAVLLGSLLSVYHPYEKLSAHEYSRIRNKKELTSMPVGIQIGHKRSPHASCHLSEFQASRVRSQGCDILDGICEDERDLYVSE